MTRFIWLTLLTLICASGCRTYIDARGQAEFCEVHHTLMSSIEVAGADGPVEASPEYVEARRRLFPHAYPIHKPSRKSTWVIYLCNDCVKAEAEWKKLHPSVDR